MSCPSRHHQHLLHGRTKTLLSHKPGVVPADVEGQEPLEIRVVDGGDYLFLGSARPSRISICTAPDPCSIEEDKDPADEGCESDRVLHKMVII